LLNPGWIGELGTEVISSTGFDPEIHFKPRIGFIGAIAAVVERIQNDVKGEGHRCFVALASHNRLIGGMVCLQRHIGRFIPSTGRSSDRQHARAARGVFGLRFHGEDRIARSGSPASG